MQEQSWYDFEGPKGSLSNSLINLNHHLLLTINTIKTGWKKEAYLPTFPLYNKSFSKLSFLLLVLVFWGMVKWKCPWKSDLLCAVCFASNGFLAPLLLYF